MRTIPLTQGKVAFVDDEDLERVMAAGPWHLWRARSGRRTMYAKHSSNRLPNQMTVLLHRFILGAEPGQLIDHINGDGLDNRRANLRFCSASQNIQNQGKAHTGTSRFKGVHWNRARCRWYARGGPHQRYLGSYDVEEEAARAYDVAARDAFGEYARLNFRTG